MGIRNAHHSSLLRRQRGPRWTWRSTDRRVSPQSKFSFCYALMHRFWFGIIHV